MTRAPAKPTPPAETGNIEARRARCFDKDWKYVKKEATDVAATFKRIRRQQAEAAKQADTAKVPHIVPKRKVA